MLLLWASWTRSVWWHETFLSNLSNFSVFETLYLWAAGVQLEGGRLWVGYWPLYSSFQSRSPKNTVEGYWQHLAKLWQNLGRQEEDVFTCDTSFTICNLRILFWPGSSLNCSVITFYLFIFLISGFSQDWGQSLLFVWWSRWTEEVSVCHHWCWMGHQARETRGMWIKIISYVNQIYRTSLTTPV